MISVQSLSVVARSSLCRRRKHDHSVAGRYALLGKLARLGPEDDPTSSPPCCFAVASTYGCWAQRISEALTGRAVMAYEAKAFQGYSVVCQFILRFRGVNRL